MLLERAAVQRIIDMALAEDSPWGDITTDSLVDIDRACAATIVSKEEGVLAGIDVAALTFATVDPKVRTEVLAADGCRVTPGVVVARVLGPAAAVLKAERVALNFLQRLSGVATSTSRYVAAISGTGARIVDTRKTTPGLRLLEKYAVRVGGGSNHRYCLSDGILIKDNHLAMMRARGSGIAGAVQLARDRAPHGVRVEVEVETLEQVREALSCGADAILLDNIGLADMTEAVKIIGGRAILEASGGINLTTVRAVAETGVQLISVGALTHSVKALDLSLEFEA